MRRRPLPRYGSSHAGLNSWRVHIARTASLADAYLGRVWRTGRSAVYKARVGQTWIHHTTPPDRRPRLPTGRKARSAAYLAPERSRSSIALALARMPAPKHFNGRAEP